MDGKARTSHRRGHGRAPRLLGVLVLVGCLTAASAALLVKAAAGVLQAGETAPVSEIDLNPLPQRSVVLAADGNLVAVLHREQNRKSVPLAEVPQVVVDTVLAVEDQDFYQHGGMNLRATARALATNVSAGDVLQGGSTITQQLVKNALLSPKQDLQRKLEEAVLAIRLEDQMTKDGILERYLNTVYFGNGTYGVQAAAEMYFGMGADELGQGEAAFLAGLIRNPIGYDPFAYPELAKERRDLVLERLVAVGQIGAPTADRLRRVPVPSERGNLDLLPKPEDYFVEEVTRRLLDDPRLGETQTERYNALFLGGLTIKTTLDPRLQTLAEEAVAATIPDPGGEFTASVVSVEPGTGAVRALVGGRGFETDQYNIATQGVGQQPGSSFKPFVLATALEQGISPASTIDGRGPCEFPNPGGTPDPYELENFEGSSGGVLSLTDATRSSVNCAYVRLGIIAGLEQVADTAARMGITTPIEPDLSMPLGTNEVLPVDMAAAYATLAADGMYHQPYLVEEVIDQEGDVLLQGASEGTQAISADTARLTTEVLEGVVSRGTATAARFADRRPAAGKTGTTSEYSDAWFVGFVPQLSTAVWMGSPAGNVAMADVGGIRVTGGSYPARIWQAYMGPALADQREEPFAEPPAPGPATSLRLEGESPAPRDRGDVAAPSRSGSPRIEREERASVADDGDSTDGSRTPGAGGEGGGGDDEPGVPAPGRSPDRDTATPRATTPARSDRNGQPPATAPPDNSGGGGGGASPGGGGGTPDDGGGSGGGGDGGGGGNCNPPGWPADNPPFPC